MGRLMTKSKPVHTGSKAEVWSLLETHISIAEIKRLTGYEDRYVSKLYMEYAKLLASNKAKELYVNRFDVEYELKYPWMKQFISLQTTDMDVAIAWNKLCKSTGDEPIKL